MTALSPYSMMNLLIPALMTMSVWPVDAALSRQYSDAFNKDAGVFAKRVLRKGKRSSKKGSSSSKEDLPTFEVFLDPANEVGPDFVGITGESGMAEVSLVSTEIDGFEGMLYGVCIESELSFDADLYHIHVASLDSNGPVVVDFSGFIDGKKTEGCVSIEKTLFMNLKTMPGIYYLNAHINNGGDISMSIRGQLVQGFMSMFDSKDMLAVTPFKDAPEGTKGEGTVMLYKQGTEVCFDVTISATEGFMPTFWHIHMAASGSNGPVKFNFSDLGMESMTYMSSSGKKSRNRRGGKKSSSSYDGVVYVAKGCMPVAQADAIALTENFGMHYFDFHDFGTPGDTTTDFVNVLRGPNFDVSDAVGAMPQ